MNQVNTICFDTVNYEDSEKGNSYLMWSDIVDVMRILAKNNYIMVVRPDDCGLTYLEFQSQDVNLGEPYPFWLSPEEEERLNCNDKMEVEDCID